MACSEWLWLLSFGFTTLAGANANYLHVIALNFFLYDSHVNILRKAEWVISQVKVKCKNARCFLYSYPYDHSETKAVKHWNCYWRKALTQIFNTEVIRAHPYIWLWKEKTKRQYGSWHSALSVTSIYRFVGSFEDISSPGNKNSWCFLDCPTNSANIAHIIKAHFIVKSKTTLPFFYFKRTWTV